MTRESGSDSPFPVTRWTLVDQAATISSVAGFEALDDLVCRYQQALRAHLILQRKIPAENADDIIQGFLNEKVLRGALLSKADRTRGRFRTFLLTALDRYTVDTLRKQHALKRHPGEGNLQDLESLGEEDGSLQPSSSTFDAEWARAIIDQALTRTRESLESSGRIAFWQFFEARIVGPELYGSPAEPYQVLVEKLGFTSPKQAGNALTSAKRKFGGMLRKIIGEYCDAEEEVEAELRELMAILSDLAA